MALHRACQPLLGLLARLLDEALAQEQAEEHRNEDDHDRPAYELPQSELPAHEQGQDDAELNHQVGGGDLEGHCGGEAGALAEQRAREGHRGIRTRGAGRTQGRRDRQGLRPVVTQQPDDGLAPDHSLDDGGKGEAQNEGPEDLPGHRAGQAEGMTEGMDGTHQRSSTSSRWAALDSAPSWWRLCWRMGPRKFLARR